MMNEKEANPTMVEKASHLVENAWETTRDAVTGAAEWVGTAAQGHANERPTEVIADDIKAITGYDKEEGNDAVGTFLNEHNNRGTVFDFAPQMPMSQHEINSYLNEKNNRMTIIDNAPEINPEVVDTVKDSAKDMKVDTKLSTPTEIKRDPLTKRQEFRRHKQFDLRKRVIEDYAADQENSGGNNVQHSPHLLNHTMKQVVDGTTPNVNKNEGFCKTSQDKVKSKGKGMNKYPGRDNEAMKDLGVHLHV